MPTKPPRIDPPDSRRCTWCGQDPLYVAYHDEEWGMPVAGDDALFEKLTLDGFQAGLAWITILRKRERFRKAFRGFAVDRVARFSQADVTRLLADEGIVRHRGKIEAAIANARLVRDLQRTRGDGAFAALLWSFAPAQPRVIRTLSEIPPSTPESVAMSAALRKQGFRFVGPTIVYAFMQAVGMVNDHVQTCPAYRRCRDAQKAFSRPA